MLGGKLANNQLEVNVSLTVSGNIVEMEVSFLERLSVIALRIAQTEKSLLEESILLVPEREGNVLKTVGVTDSGNAVFTPTISS